MSMNGKYCVVTVFVRQEKLCFQRFACESEEKHAFLVSQENRSMNACI